VLDIVKSFLHDQMAAIPGGVIDLRDDRIHTKWTVEIKPFLLAKYPVTVELYFAVTGKPVFSLTGDRRPVVNISWNEAVVFCNLLSRDAGFKEVYLISKDGAAVTCDWEADGFRLPTEAEWQYACQAGNNGYRYGEIDQIAWYHGNSGDEIHEIGQKDPNVWGLYDMLGNVWEWCWDVYDVKKYGAYRIFRGGGWAEETRGCGATCRRRGHPTFRIDDLGFRVARSL